MGKDFETIHTEILCGRSSASLAMSFRRVSYQGERGERALHGAVRGDGGGAARSVEHAVAGRLGPGAATTLQVLHPADRRDAGLPARRSSGRACRNAAGQPGDVGRPWRPWTAPAGPTQPEGSSIEISLPPDIAEPIPSDGGRLPFIGFAVKKASEDGGVLTLFLYTIISTAICVRGAGVHAEATHNIVISVIASGIVLVLLAAPTIGLGAIWVALVYAMIGGSMMVVGNRLQT